MTRLGLALCAACVTASPGSAVAALPSASTGAAKAVTAGSATLTGAVNPNGQATTWFFQFGPTKAYGAQTPTQGPSPAVKQSIPVAASVTGLSPGTTYHFRLVAASASGTRNGGDRTFRTIGSISLAPRPRFVTFGAPATLSGQLSGSNAGGVKVTLKENPFPFAGFRNVATTRTDSTGRYSFARIPAVDSQYQAVAATRPQTASAVRLLLVRMKVSLRLSATRPRSGNRVVFSGRVQPVHNGRVVVIQRLVRGTWRAVRRTRLRASLDPAFSSYRTSMAVRHGGLYRAHVGHDADHAPGSSAARRIRLR